MTSMWHAYLHVHVCTCIIRAQVHPLSPILITESLRLLWVLSWVYVIYSQLLYIYTANNPRQNRAESRWIDKYWGILTSLFRLSDIQTIRLSTIWYQATVYCFIHVTLKSCNFILSCKKKKVLGWIWTRYLTVAGPMHRPLTHQSQSY